MLISAFLRSGIRFLQGRPLDVAYAPHLQLSIPSRALNTETLSWFSSSVGVLSSVVDFDPFGRGLAGGDGRAGSIFGEQGCSSGSFRARVLRPFVPGGVLGGLISASVTLDPISPRVLSVEDMAEQS